MRRVIMIPLACSVLTLQANELSDLKERVASLEKVQKAKQQETLKEALNKSNSFNQKSFIPDISLILSGSAVSRNIKNSDYEGYGIDGFVDAVDEIPFNKNRGFDFNYAELGMYSDVGPYFTANAIFHLHPTEFEIEEAYITTTKLPANIEIKAGKFRSGFGRINTIHRHAQHFVTQPLVYEAMLGVEGINDAGVALHWVAPTENYLLVGVESMQGENELSFGYPENNNLFVAYLKTAFDFSDNITALVGGSVARGKTTEHKNSTLYGGELTLQYIIDSYSSLKWQSEYLSRDKAGVKQAGYYTQLLYDLNRNWEFGGRYDALNKNAANSPDDLKKYSAMVQYKPFEFSKIRLQFTKDQSKSFGGVRQTEHMMALEFLVETGAHGAHAF